MEEGGVSYETLQELLRSERRSNKLTPVPNGFWSDLRGFLKEAEEEFRREQQKDPWARRAMMLSDRVKNARHAAETVWALRERKLAMLALAHAKDGARPDGLTKRESVIYDQLLGVLQEGRRTVFEDTVPAPVSPAASAPPAQEPPTSQGPMPGEDVDEERTEAERVSDEVPAAPAPQAESEPQTVPADKPDGPLVTIRALGDIPPFVGPDMQTYLLQEGDLASVPDGIAQLLVRRGKAAVVDAL